jgi:outer membrane protein OmpU
MNNFKKIGLSALAGSLAAFSANAAEMSVSGSAKLTYYNGNTDEVTGNPYGMNTSMGFTGTGDVNGYETTLFITSADSVGGMSSASLAVDLGDLGTITFDQGVGVGGISTIDDKTPSAKEEIWDSLDSQTGDENGLVGGGNAGVFVYANSFMGNAVSIQYGKGQATNSDDAVGGSGGASSWDFAVTNGGLYEGLNVGAGYGEIANASAGDSVGSSEDTDAHYTAFATYTFGAVTAGYQQSVVENNTTGGADEEAQAWSIAANVMEGLSLSYGEREVEFMNASAAHVTEDMEGVAIAYTVGSATLSIQENETSANGGNTGTDDKNLEIALALSF